MLVQGDNILNLIPQRPPIVMIDKFISVEDKVSHTGLTVDETNIFVKQGLLREPGLIENIAQSAAAGVGYVYKNEGKAIPLGFIGALKNLQIHFLPCVGDDLRTRVEVLHVVFETTLVSGKIFVGEKCAAECEMKIYLLETK